MVCSVSLFQDVRTCPTLLHPSLSSQFQTDNDHPVVAEECADSRQRDISDLDILVGPLVEQLDAANLLGDILGQDGVALGLLDFDFSGVRHVGDVMGGRKGRGWRGSRSRFVGGSRRAQILSDRVWAFATPGDLPSGLGAVDCPTCPFIAQSLTYRPAATAPTSVLFHCPARLYSFYIRSFAIE